MNKHKILASAVVAVIAGSVHLPEGMAATLIKPATSRTVENAAPVGPSRFIVKYRSGAVERSNNTAANQGIAQAATRAGLQRALPATAALPAQPAATAALMRRMGAPGWSVVRASRALNAVQAEAFMRELRANPAVERVELDSWMVPTISGRANALVPNDPDYANYQWNLLSTSSGVHAPEAWARSQGEGVVVAVIDTGIAQGNPDLQANLLPGYDMISEKLASRRESDARIPGGWDQGDWIEENYCTQLGLRPHPAKESGWHGTHVAGTIAQQTDNNLGLAGLAYRSKIVPVRVLGSCGGLASDIADGIVWAVGGQVPGIPVNPNPAEVLNMSLGSETPQACPAFYQDAIDFAVNKGAIVVAASGNSGGDADTYTMGSCSNVILVAATGNTGAAAFFSNKGSRVALSAPGGSELGKGTMSSFKHGYIWQMINGGKSRPEAGNWIAEGYSGTSMAAPHVAAAAAMIQSVAATPLNLLQMGNLLKRTATPIDSSPPKPPIAVPQLASSGSSEVTGMGAGILNIDAALLELESPHCSLDLQSCERPCDPFNEDCGPTLVPIVLTNKVELKGQGGDAGSHTLYSFEAEAGKVLSFMTYGGSGDLSMYVSYGKPPIPAVADARSVRRGTPIETVRFTAAKAGKYFIRLVAPASFSYSGVTVVARQ